MGVRDSLATIGGGIFEVFCEDFEGKTIQRVKEKMTKTMLITI